MLDLGVPLTTILDVVGHADFDLTRTTYAHLAVSIERDGADKMSLAFGSPARRRIPTGSPSRAVERGTRAGRTPSTQAWQGSSEARAGDS